ncbi:putative ribonuclease H-like domain-containing protein [Tanacetum coccineum]
MAHMALSDSKFKEPEFKGYGPENSKKESNGICENSSNETKNFSDAPLLKKRFNNEEEVESHVWTALLGLDAQRPDVDHVIQKHRVSVTLKRISITLNGCIGSGEARVQQRKRRIQRRVQQKQKDQEDEVFGRILSAKKMKTIKELTTAGYRVTTAGSRLLLLVTYSFTRSMEWRIHRTMLWPKFHVNLGELDVEIRTFSETGTSTATKMTVPSTIEEKTCKKNDVKVRSPLLMALSNEHQLTFDQYVDAQSIASSSESLDSIFNRLQRLVSRLAILGVVTPPEDLDVKFLRSLPSGWDTHMVVWMNKPDFDTIGLDDLYNNFKIVEQKVKKSAGASNDDKNLAFVTNSGASSTNNINTVNPEVSTASTKFMKDIRNFIDDDLEEMDLKWNMALLSMRARKFYQRTGRKIIIDGSNTAGYDKSKVECFNCIKKGQFCLRSAIDGGDLIGVTWQRKKFRQTWLSWHSQILREAFSDSEYDDLLVKLTDTNFKAATYKRGLATLEGPTPLDLSYQILSLMSMVLGISSLNLPMVVDKESDNSKENTDDSLELDDEEQDESKPKSEKKTVIPTVKKKEFVKAKQDDKTVRNTVKYAEMYRSQKPRGNQSNWNNLKSQQLGNKFVMNNKACFACGSFNHLIKDCKRKNVLPSSKRNFVPKAVLMKTGMRPVNAAKPKAAYNDVKRNRFNAVKASACWVWMPKNRVVDHGRKIDLINEDHFCSDGCIGLGVARVQQRKRRIQRRVQQKQKDQEDEVFGRILSAKKMKSYYCWFKITAVGEKVNAAESLLVVSTEHCVRTWQYLNIGDFGNEYQEKDKTKAKPDETEHEIRKSMEKRV